MATSTSPLRKIIKQLTGYNLDDDEITIFLIELPPVLAIKPDGLYIITERRYTKDGQTVSGERVDVRIDDEDLDVWLPILKKSAQAIHKDKENIDILFNNKNQRKKFVIWLYKHMLAGDNVILKKIIEPKASSLGTDRITITRLYNEYGYKNSPDLSFDHLADEINYFVLIPLFDEFRAETKKTYATRAKAKEEGAITNIAPNFPISTLHDFENALGLYPHGKAYIQLLDATKNFKFEDGTLSLDDGKGLKQLTEVEVKDYITNENVTKINLTKLRIIYGLYLKEIAKNGYSSKETICISVPALAKAWYSNSSLNQKIINRTLADIQSFNNIAGFYYEPGVNRPSIVAVLAFIGYNAKTKIVEVKSAYIDHIIRQIYRESWRISQKNKKSIVDKKGLPKTKPAYSYLAKNSLALEKDHYAVECVMYILQTIEKAGRGKTKQGREIIPNIGLNNLLERTGLQDKVDVDPKHGTTLLKRAFVNVWKYLNKDTSLNEKYYNLKVCVKDSTGISAEKKLSDITKNDAVFIPTMTSLHNNFVFRFIHDGKKAE